MASKKPVMSKKSRNEERVLTSLNAVKNPVRNSIIVWAVWQTIVIAFAITLHFVNDRSWLFNLSTSFGIGLGLGVLWVIIRIGLLEGARLKFKNWSNERVVKTLDIKSSKVRIDLQKYRALNKQRSWIGIWLMLGINLVAFVITIAIYYA